MSTAHLSPHIPAAGLKPAVPTNDTATDNAGANPMTDPAVTINPGSRFAFAPYTFPNPDGLYRIYVVFENGHGDLFCAGTDIMVPGSDTANEVCDTLNLHVGLNRDQWKFFASAVFGTVEAAQRRAAAETQRGEDEGSLAPYDPDDYEDW